jgi:hypothetical protein
MLHLATLSGRGAGEAPNLLVTRAVDQDPGPPPHSLKSVRTGLAVTVSVRKLDEVSDGKIIGVAADKPRTHDSLTAHRALMVVERERHLAGIHG